MRSGFDKRKGFTKRAGFKNKTGFDKKSGLEPSGIDKTKLKRNGYKQKKRKTERRADPLRKEIQKCDTAFSKMVRLAAANSRGTVKCFTCNYKGFWKRGGIQCGHYKSRSHYKTRWLMANAKPQCKFCNQNLNGNIPIYEQRLVEAFGDDVLFDLDTRSREVVRLELDAVRTLRLRIEKKVKAIKKEKGL